MFILSIEVKLGWGSGTECNTTEYICKNTDVNKHTHKRGDAMGQEGG